MKKLLCLLLCLIAIFFVVGCQNKDDDTEYKAGPWANFKIDRSFCSGFKEDFEYFKYENELSLVFPDFGRFDCNCNYSYSGMINLETKKEWDNFQVGYPEFVFKDFEDDNIVKIHGESYFIFGTAEYVLNEPTFEISEKTEEYGKTYKAVCDGITLLTVTIELNENAEDGFYGEILKQIQNNLVVL